MKQNKESPKGIRGEKLRHGKFERENLVSTNEAQASPKKGGGRNQVPGRVGVPFWHSKPVTNAPKRQRRHQGHVIG